MIRSIVVLIILVGLNINLALGQKVSMTKASESDPEARAILEKLKTRYDGFESMSVDFTLSIKFPEQVEELQKGRIAQQGNKYHVNIASQTIISNGETLWLYLKNNNEVQINDATTFSEEAGMLSPNDLLKIYESEDFVYALINEFSKDGTIIQQIEFKPLTEDAEYRKVRLEVDRKANQIKSMEAFAEDGSRYKLTISKFTPNVRFAANHFSFDPADYPGIYVEDLRE